MTQETAAVVLSILALAGNVLNVWLKMQITIDLQRSEKNILETIAKDYVRRDLVDVKIVSLEARVLLLEKKSRD